MTYTKKEEMSLVAYAELLESDEQEFEAKNTPSGFTGRASHVRSSPVQSSPVAESWPILWHPMDCSTPGFPVHHPLPELTQTPVHRVSDAIQPSHPLWSPSPPDFNLFQHQSLFRWVSSSHQVAKILEFLLQHQSFQWTPRTDFLSNGLVGSPCSPRDSPDSCLLQHHTAKASVLWCSAFL